MYVSVERPDWVGMQTGNNARKTVEPMCSIISLIVCPRYTSRVLFKQSNIRLDTFE